ncbi:MAG TPA: response regulator [bacterium]|nr:response regulator [bacterium]HOL47127.1 response regulator [bacterium]HPQ17916.1 response regulator [bacterium]
MEVIPKVKKPDGGPYKFLVVDDSQFMRKQIERIIIQIGCEVSCEAENGKDAIEKYKANKPDVVTMDITMPEMNGVEALRQIMAIDKNAIVIMMTAVGHDTIVKQSILLGAKHFIVKPFKPTEAARTIVSVLKKLGGQDA